MPRETPPDVVRRILDPRLWLEANLNLELSVVKLARVANMSIAHFQRTFRKVVGETAGAHLRRLRLERAAVWLRDSTTPVTTIALESGFQSHAGFTHGFTQLFGMPPTMCRDRSDVRPFIRLPHEGRSLPDAAALAQCPLTVSLVEVPERTLAVMRHTGSLSSLPAVWSKMAAWCRRRGLLNDEAVFLGLHHDDWDSTRPDAYRYDAAVVVPSDFRPNGEVSLFIQPEGLVAVTAFGGSLLKMDALWRWFIYEWLPASGFQFLTAHVYDRYPPDLISGSALANILRTLTGITAQLCIPVCRDWID